MLRKSFGVVCILSGFIIGFLLVGAAAAGYFHATGKLSFQLPEIPAKTAESEGGKVPAVCPEEMVFAVCSVPPQEDTWSLATIYPDWAMADAIGLSGCTVEFCDRKPMVCRPSATWMPQYGEYPHAGCVCQPRTTERGASYLTCCCPKGKEGW